MDKDKMLKLGMSVLGLALTIGSTLVNSKISDAKLEEAVAEKVKEALEKQYTCAGARYRPLSLFILKEEQINEQSKHGRLV